MRIYAIFTLHFIVAKIVINAHIYWAQRVIDQTLFTEMVLRKSMEKCGGFLRKIAYISPKSIIQKRREDMRMIGRKEEIAILDDCLENNRPERLCDQSL